MADNSAKVAKMTRILAFLHLIVGFLLICFGIADRVIEFRYSWTGYGYFGIWIGVWMCITGGLGIPGSGRERTGSRNAFAGVFMGFSITSAVFGGIIIICYSISINESRERKQRYLDRNSYYYGHYSSWKINERFKNYDASMAIGAIILILGIAEFVIGIWAAICCCLMTPCGCCVTQQQDQQVAYAANPTGYVMAQGPDGVPVAVPMQGGGGMVAFQAAGTQGHQTPMVLVPMGGQSMTAQAAPTGGLFATGYQTQQEDKPPQYEI